MSVFKKYNILSPKNIDLTKWCVVVCDQYTSQADYWEKLEEGIGAAPSKLAVGTLQIFLDKFVKEHGGEIDYIHGSDVTKTLSEKSGAIGFILPSMEKSQLFETVIHDGALPRKTFSMGEAHDKKFYMECKKIKMGF